MSERMKDILIYLAVALLIVVCLWGAALSEQRWRDFSDQHNCVVVGKTNGDVSFGSTSDGKTITTFNPGKTGYKCDDGITYWR